MKKLFFTLLLMAGVVLPQYVGAQGTHQTVTVGTGTSDDHLAPFNNYYRNSTTEMIYTETEIGTVGTIDTIWFYSTTSTGFPCTSLKVYMGTTSASTFASNNSWLLSSDLEEVFDGGAITVGGSVGWYAIPLQNPYAYMGDNLVVVVTKTATDYSSSCKWQYTSISNTVLYCRSDSDASYGSLSSLTASTSGTTSSSRPNIKLSINASVSGCPRVTRAVVDSIGENMAVISWHNPTAGEQALQHVLLEYKANESSTWTSFEVEDDTTYTLTGLQEGTSYTVRLTAICDIDSSSVATLTFETPTCGEYAGGTTTNGSVPFHSNYDYGYSQTIYPGTALSGVSVITGISFRTQSVPSNHTTRTVSIAMGNTTRTSLSTSNYIADSTLTHVADSVPMDVSTAGWVYIPFATPFSYDGSSNVVVAVTNLTGDYSSFSFYHHTPTVGNAVYWYRDNTPISGSSPGGTSGTSTTVPDVRFEANCGGATSMCIRPMNFTVTDLTYNSATLGWTGCEDAISHQICYGTTNDLAAYQSSAVPIYDVNYYFDNLEDSTTYYVWVRSLCSDDTTAWASFSFTTQVACSRVLNAQVDSVNESMAVVVWATNTVGQTLQHVIVEYKADDASAWTTDSVLTGTSYTIMGLQAGTSYTVRLISICEFDTSSVVLLTFETPTCGEYAGGTTTNGNVPFQGNYDYGYSQTIYPASALSGVTTITGISFHTSSAPSNYTTRTVTIAMGNTTQSTLSTSNYVAYSSMTEVVSNAPMDVSTPGWIYIPFSTPFAYDGSSNVVVAVTNLTGDYSSFSFYHHTPTVGNAVYWYRDNTPISGSSPGGTSGTSTTVPDVRFEADCGGIASNCERPTDFSADYISYNSVDLSWTGCTYADSYEVRYGTTTSVTDSTAVTVTTSSDIFTLAGLRNNTTYYIWVRSVCGDEYSGWSAPLSVTTQLACATLLNAHIDDTSQSYVSLSWEVDTTVGQALTEVVVAWRSVGDTVWNTDVVTDINAYVITGLRSGVSYELTLTSVCGTDSSSALSLPFTTPACHEYAGGTATNSYVPFYGLYSYGYSQTIYPGTALGDVDTIRGISFLTTSAPSSYLTRPVSVAMGNTSQTSLTTSNYIAYSSMTEVVSQYPMDVSTPGWIYIPFTTPFIYDGTSNIVVAVTNHTGSYSGFSFSHHSTSVGNSVYWYRDSSPIDPSSPEGTSGTTTTVPDIRFDAPCNISGCNPPVIVVGQISSTDIQISWIPITDETEWIVGYKTSGHEWTYSNTTTTSHVFSGLVPETEYMLCVGVVCDGDTAFRQITATTLNGTVSICFPPYGLSASATSASEINVSWIPLGTEQQWQVHIYNDATDSSFIATASSCHVEGLDTATEYQVEVRAVCGEGDSSDWCSSVSVTTEEAVFECMVPVQLTVIAATDSSFVLTWTPQGRETKWQVRVYNMAYDSLYRAYSPNVVVGGLARQTTYNVRTRAVCGDGDTSDWSVATHYTTTSGVGIEGVDGTASVSIYPNPATHTASVDVSGISGRVTISVLDISGRVLRNEQMECDATCVKTLQVDGLAPGAYFVRVASDTYSTVRKLFVE